MPDELEEKIKEMVKLREVIVDLQVTQDMTVAESATEELVSTF